MGGRGRPSSSGAGSALTRSNKAVHEALKDASADRLRYLLALAPMFRHFIHPQQLRKAGISLPEPKKETSEKKKSGRTRMTEEAEDKLMLEAASSSGSSLLEIQTTRLTEQPSCIKNGTMRPYQIEGLNFLIGLYERSLNGILADEMGLGKTLQTISMIGFLRQYKNINGPHIIIVPKSTLGNWMNEFKKWLPEANVARFHGTAEERKELCDRYLKDLSFDVLVTTYEMCNKESSSFSKIMWRYLVIDEAHRIKNENSLLSQVVRLFQTQARLLITGTPLQNNLHELWALLNFLLPDVFSRSEDFDEWFASVDYKDSDEKEGEKDKGNENDDEEKDRKSEIVHQLHSVLRPFLIRRLKVEVEHTLPPKKEIILSMRLSQKQVELYKNILMKNVDAINGRGGDRARLLNIFMQLRKCVNHPYLFEGVEDRTLDPFGEHLIDNCYKLKFLDRLLHRLQKNGHRILIFSQMTRVLDILEDYCTMRQFEFCRIDGSTDGDLRDEQIADFNIEGSTKFIFLLSTRAGGLGINLATADTVILYDSDFNAQVDLQAMDRAHRIGQRKPVNVYRLITEDTIETRMLKISRAKLHLDTVVIQQGRLTEQKKNMNKNDLLDAVRFGSDRVFKSDYDFKDEDLDVILERGEAKTKEMDKELKEQIGDGKGGLDALDFSNKEFKGVYHFKGVDYKGQRASSNFALEIGKRKRIQSYDESNFFKDPARGGPSSNTVDKKFQLLKYRREPLFNTHCLCDVARLKQIAAMERLAVDKFNDDADKALKEGKDEPKVPDDPAMLLDPSVRFERETILKSAIRNWSRREYNSFIRGMERHGRTNFEQIQSEIGPSKTIDEVKSYSVRFWQVGHKYLDSWERIVKGIKDGEEKIARRKKMEEALKLKVGRYRDPWKELDISYYGQKSKNFVEEEDRWLVCMTEKLGYGRWDDIKIEVRRSWQFRFDWFLKSRTTADLKRRVDGLIRLIEKENAEIAEADRLAQRKKEAQKRRGERDQSSGVPKLSTKKRKTEQTNMSSYFKPVGANSTNNINGSRSIASGSHSLANGNACSANGTGSTSGTANVTAPSSNSAV